MAALAKMKYLFQKITNETLTLSNVNIKTAINFIIPQISWEQSAKQIVQIQDVINPLVIYPIASGRIQWRLQPPSLEQSYLQNLTQNTRLLGKTEGAGQFNSWQ